MVRVPGRSGDERREDGTSMLSGWGPDLKEMRRSVFDQTNLVFTVRYGAEHFERVLAFRTIPVGEPGGNVEDVARSDTHLFVSESDGRLPSEDQLLMLDPIRVLGDPPSRLHDEAPHMEGRTGFR